MKSSEFIAQSVWGQIKQEIHRRFNDGQATCTYAVYELGKALAANDILFKVHSGEYNGAGHWWITVDNMVYDLGNNATDTSIDTGKIKPEFGIRSNAYKTEDTMNFTEYAQYYATIKDM